jgi:hypothetical protein
MYHDNNILQLVWYHSKNHFYFTNGLFHRYLDINFVKIIFYRWNHGYCDRRMIYVIKGDPTRVNLQNL